MKSINSNSVKEQGFWYFLDITLVSVGGAVFWFIISIFSSPADVGYATTILSLVSIITGLLSIGFDYALLREIGDGLGEVYGTLMILKISLLLVSAPIILFLGQSIYEETLVSHSIIGAMMVITGGIMFVSKFSLIGLMKTRLVAGLECLGMIIRLVVGPTLVLLGLGSLGILTSFLATYVTIGIITTVITIREIGFSWGGREILFKLTRLVISNMPARATNVVISSAGVVILALLTGDASAVGVFYMALMISMATSAIGTSLATVTLPISMVSEEDEWPTSIRIGICLTAPFVSMLIVSPDWILGLIGQGYVSGASQLIILSFAIIPNIILMNAIAKLNHVANLRMLIYIGFLQLFSFLALLFPLTLTYGANGAAWAFLISSVITSIWGLRILGKDITKPLMVSVSCVIIATGLGSIFLIISPILAILISFVVGMTWVHVLKGITFQEIFSLIKQIFGKSSG